MSDCCKSCECPRTCRERILHAAIKTAIACCKEIQRQSSSSNIVNLAWAAHVALERALEA